MFAQRFISAVVLLALAGVALVTGGTFLLVLSAIVALCGTYELLKVDSMHKTVPGCISYISVIGFYLMVFLGYCTFFEVWVVVSVMLLLASYVFTYPKFHVKNIAICLLAILYAGLLVSYIYQIRCMVYGNWFVWLVLIGASGSDTFAYLTGMLIGKHHFSELSPKKTVEGCVGGVLGAALLALVYSVFIPEEAVQSINVQVLFVCIGISCSVVSQVGDLAASAIKRNYGIKDYSNLIPGHGGILDRFDSILFVAPIVYYLLYWFIV